MSQLNVSVLAAARDSYTEQLRNHLTPLIYEGFISLYEDAKKKEDEHPEFNYNYLKQFQTLLKDIPHWNQSILEEETRRILHEIEFLMQLVTAVCISHVKILSSIKLGGSNKNFQMTIPTTVIFIHTVYCKAAEMFYYNPYKFRNYNSRENYESIIEMIDKSISDATNVFIPIESLLKEYLSDVFTNNVKQNPNYASAPRQEEDFSNIINNNAIGLNDNDNFSFGSNTSSVTPYNENFEVGNIKDDYGDDFNVGKDFDDYGKDDMFKDYMFKDDSTEAAKTFEEDPFKSSSSNEDPFKSSSSNEDPFKSSSSDDNDPFKTSSSDDNDPFKTSSSNEDPFKINDIPTPPDLKEDIFEKKNNEISFFDELP